MRLLALADVPVDIDLAATVDAERVDAVVCLGDLEQWAIQGLAGVTVPKVGVYGNHDWAYMDALGIVDLHLRATRIGDLVFAGVEGCVRYKPGARFQYEQEEIVAAVASWPRVDVVLTHCPPFGVNDDPTDPAHIGWVGLRQYVERCEPAWLLHGHTYPDVPQTQLGATQIRYVHGHAILDIS